MHKCIQLSPFSYLYNEQGYNSNLKNGEYKPTTSTLPFSAAIIRALRPDWSTSSTDALWARSSWTQSMWPANAAAWRGVLINRDSRFVLHCFTDSSENNANDEHKQQIRNISIVRTILSFPSQISNDFKQLGSRCIFKLVPLKFSNVS